MAERSDIIDSITTTGTPETENIDSEQVETSSSKTSSVTSDQIKDTPINAPDESLLIVSDSVTESTLL